MIKLPIGVDINNLIDDLRIFSWEAAELLLFYSKIIKKSDRRNEIIQTKNNEDPVTLADLEVNKLIINRIQENYQKITQITLTYFQKDMYHHMLDMYRKIYQTRSKLYMQP